MHGVPETSAVWSEVLPLLRRSDVLAVSLPGFGAATPVGFEASMDEYASWLAELVEGYDQVDLVGHDWGGLLVLRVLSTRPPNVRTWAVDNGDLDTSFVWHDGARAWQAEESGEALAEWLGNASDAEKVRILEGLGVPAAHAPSMASAIDPAMTAATLSLYRSAVDIGRSWGADLDNIAGPGLCVHAGRDPYRNAESARRLASRVGADLLVLPDAGHFLDARRPAPGCSTAERLLVGRGLTGHP